ncbi:MAG TPA: hypothetical protein VK217_10840, partial [Acidimicrobiales bacterium]|nr:hypothetical protein [Acidimicrobiales bacterium]
NIRTPERYVAAMTSGRSVVAGEERLEPDQRVLEGLQLSVRTREGVEATSLPLEESLAGLVERGSGRAVLTRRGRLLANEVACRLRSPARTA